MPKTKEAVKAQQRLNAMKPLGKPTSMVEEDQHDEDSQQDEAPEARQPQIHARLSDFVYDFIKLGTHGFGALLLGVWGSYLCFLVNSTMNSHLSKLLTPIFGNVPLRIIENMLPFAAPYASTILIGTPIAIFATGITLSLLSGSFNPNSGEGSLVNNAMSFLGILSPAITFTASMYLGFDIDQTYWLTTGVGAAAYLTLGTFFADAYQMVQRFAMLFQGKPAQRQNPPQNDHQHEPNPDPDHAPKVNKKANGKAQKQPQPPKPAAKQPQPPKPAAKKPLLFSNQAKGKNNKPTRSKAAQPPAQPQPRRSPRHA